MGVVVRRFNTYLIIIFSYNILYSSINFACFGSSTSTFCSLFKKFFILYN